MSTVTNEGIKMHFKTVMANFFTAVGLLVGPSTAIAKPECYIEAYISISQPSFIVTYSSPVINSYLLSSFLLRIILRSNSRIRQSRACKWIIVESEVINSTALCGTIIGTGKIKGTESRNCISIINLIKERCFFWEAQCHFLNYCWINQEQVVPVILWYQPIFHSDLS